MIAKLFAVVKLWWYKDTSYSGILKEENTSFSMHALRNNASFGFCWHYGFRVIIIFSVPDIWIVSYRSHVFIFTDVYQNHSHTSWVLSKQTTSFSWLNHHHAHVKAAAATAVLDKAVVMALSAETCCLSYPNLYVACMTDFEKYIWKENEDVSSKNVYFCLCENLDNLEVFGIEQDEPVHNSA
jgi:hypothetical protein